MSWSARISSRSKVDTSRAGSTLPSGWRISGSSNARTTWTRASTVLSFARSRLSALSPLVHAGDVDVLHRRRHVALGLEEVAQRLQAHVADLGHPHVRLAGGGVLVRRLLRGGQRIEQGRLSRLRETENAELHGVFPPEGPPIAIAGEPVRRLSGGRGEVKSAGGSVGLVVRAHHLQQDRFMAVVLYEAENDPQVVPCTASPRAFKRTLQLMGPQLRVIGVVHQQLHNGSDHLNERGIPLEESLGGPNKAWGT